MGLHNFNFTESGYVPGDLNFYFAPLPTPPTSYPILKGQSNNFSSVWADDGASLINGKFYTAGEGYFNVVKLDDQSIYDWYSESRKGRTNETLESNDIVDINVTK